MKKILLSILFTGVYVMMLHGQSILHDNGPLVNLPAGGAGGADVSHLHSGLSTYGFGHAVSTMYRVADDFVVPAGEVWTIDSIILYAYQTSSGNISTINEVNWMLWDGIPENAGSNVIVGDTLTNSLISSTWSGIYRTNSTAFTNTDRPIMRNSVSGGGTVLQPGTYWLDWRTGGTLSSGPWAPAVTIANVTTTGNARQFNPTLAPGSQWLDILDNSNGQGMPFILMGSSATSVNTLYNNGMITVFPNPVSSSAVINIDPTLLSDNNIYFTLYDITGRIVNEINVVNPVSRIDRGKLSSGIYNYVLSAGKEKVSIGKLIVQ